MAKIIRKGVPNCLRLVKYIAQTSTPATQSP
jgi:hypothetical protein